MSSTGQATSPFENVKLIINALADYAKETGIDLSKNPFAAKLEQLRSPEDILQLLGEREKAFKEYCEGDRRLTNFLNTAVKVLHAFSGILSKAAGLIPFPPTSILFVGIDTLLGAAREVSSGYDALSDLFEHLGSFLERLDIYTKIQLTPIMTGIIVKIMAELLSVLALATKQIKERRFKKFAKKLLGEREIEEVLQRLNQLTQEEARIAVAETLGLVHGLVGNVKLIMEDREASMDGIRRDSIALQQLLSKINKMNNDQLQRDVQHWLSPPDPSTNHIFVSKVRHSGTAAWFFKSEAFKNWITKGSLLWIHGKPGAGKSTLLSAIIEDVEGKRAIGLAKMVYYYFDFRDPKKQDCYGLLSSLILQLSLESDPCCNILSKLYSGNNRARKPTRIALEKCMKDMLSQQGQGPIYIIVDGLDECPNSSGTPSARREVLDLIKELVGLKRLNVHVCVASRPEIDIRMVLGSLEPLQISLDDEIGQKADIIAFIEDTVHSNSMPEWTEGDQSLVINTLSQKANGMFRWVACQMDNVIRCYSNDIQGALDDLPVDLDETYERTLRNIDNQKRKYAKRLFQCLSVSIRPLRVDELADIFAVQFDVTSPGSFNNASRPRNAEWAVLSACSCLITTVSQGERQVVQFSHSSVKEFLTSERLANAEGHLSFYHILPEPSHTTLAQASISVLLQLDDKINRDTIGCIPLALYAARHWVDHAQYSNVSSHIQELMERLFDPTKSHFAAWVWLYDIDRHWVEPMSTIHPTRPEAGPLYYASLCGFHRLVERLLSVYSSDVNSRGGFHTTPLHAATIMGRLEIASLLIENGADPNARDSLDQVPLHLVSRAGQLVMAQSSLEIARLLVDSGADVDAIDELGTGSTPLHAAAVYGRRNIAELLLESGATLDIRNWLQETPLQVACRSGKSDVSRFLIDRGSDINSRDLDSFTPLHQASRHGHIDIAQLLLDYGSEVDVPDLNRWTPLHSASRYGYLDVSRLLINCGADVNARAEGGWTPIHFASGNGHVNITKFLVERGVNVDSRSDTEETPLHRAAGSGFLDIVRFLIESGAAVSTRDDKDWTPFHKASFSGHLQVVGFLLECGVDVNIRNYGNGETSLHLVSGSGQLDVVRFLIDHSADIHVKDDHHSNPLHTASKNGQLIVVQLLVHAGVAVDIRNGTQMTPLALASCSGKVGVGSFLIERGANPNVRDKRSRAPLHFASRHGHVDMAQLLLGHGIDPNIQDDDLWSPLHLASANGHLSVAELLVQHGASIDIANDKQETPLYQAVWNGKVDIARLLIYHGADLHSTDNDGQTPLHAASRCGDLEVIKLLLRSGADVDMLNKANKTAVELASKNGRAKIARFISEYKADANIFNEVQSARLDTAQSWHCVDEDGNDEAIVSLHTAADEGNVEAVQLELDRGADINSRDAYNKTPLDGAAAKGNIDVVRFLVERGAEVDPRNKWGWTPLLSASLYGHLEVSRILIDHGANVNAREADNYTPLGLSARNGYLGIVKLLLEHGADINATDDSGETPYQASQRSGSRETIDFLRERSAGVTRLDEILL